MKRGVEMPTPDLKDGAKDLLQIASDPCLWVYTLRFMHGTFWHWTRDFWPRSQRAGSYKIGAVIVNV